MPTIPDLDTRADNTHCSVKPGIVRGETGDFSYNVVKDPVHIHSFNATLLHLLDVRDRNP